MISPRSIASHLSDDERAEFVRQPTWSGDRRARARRRAERHDIYQGCAKAGTTPAAERAVRRRINRAQHVEDVLAGRLPAILAAGR